VKIVLAGGTGFIGRALLRSLVIEGHRVIVLTREPAQIANLYGGSVKVERWDGRTSVGWAPHIADTDAVINLAGASVAGGRWTPQRKDLLLKSRIEPTKALVSAIVKSPQKPMVMINASAVGFYGDVPKFDVTESAPRGSDYLSTLVGAWEHETQPAADAGTRVSLMRFGIVLENDGGALPRMLLPFRWYAGGWFGDGKQWFPWIHRDDAVRAIMEPLENPYLSGPINVAAPQLVTLKEFCATLGKIIDRPSWAPVPAAVLRILLGEMADMLLSGQRIIPQKLLDAKFGFTHPTLEATLRAILLPSAQN
jgi:uncharacterized protein (TIGR01777 family)